jgi:hypothetical protein
VQTGHLVEIEEAGAGDPALSTPFLGIARQVGTHVQDGERAGGTGERVSCSADEVSRSDAALVVVDRHLRTHPEDKDETGRRILELFGHIESESWEFRTHTLSMSSFGSECRSAPAGDTSECHDNLDGVDSAKKGSPWRWVTLLWLFLETNPSRLAKVDDNSPIFRHCLVGNFGPAH